MYNEDEIIRKAVQKAYRLMLKAEMCVDLLENIYTSADLYPDVNEPFDYALNCDVRDSLETIISKLKYYKI